MQTSSWLAAHWRWLTAAAGSLLLLVAAGGYLIDILRLRARPNRFAWTVFFVGATGGAWYTYKGHAGLTGVLVALVGAILIGLTWLASLTKKYGHRELEKWFYPWVAAAGVLVYSLQLIIGFSPLAAVITAVIVDLTAIAVQWHKSWNDPYSETVLPWTLGTLGAMFGLVSLVNWNPTSAIWPVYFVVTNLVIVCILLWRQPRVQPPKRARTD